MNPAHHIQSYRFWDVVTQWGLETLRHEHVVARVLAKAVVVDGLRVQSVDPQWESPGTFELRGHPMVGYVAQAGQLPIFIRSAALRHLQDIVSSAAVPNPQMLWEEFVTKQDLGAWLRASGIQPPSFWFETDYFSNFPK
jgi:hypothetical protein